jgi:hypothetical protein
MNEENLNEENVNEVEEEELTDLAVSSEEESQVKGGPIYMNYEGIKGI